MPEQRAADDERDEPVLPEVTKDERRSGWGEDGREDDERRSVDWYREQRPPHHE
jgi:hypothetical protein